MNKNKIVTIFYIVQSIIAFIVPISWVLLPQLSIFGYSTLIPGRIFFLCLLIFSSIVSIAFFLLFSHVIMYRQAKFISQKKFFVGVCIMFLPVLVLFASFSLVSFLKKKLVEKRESQLVVRQNQQNPVPQNTDNNSQSNQTTTLGQNLVQENLSQMLTPKEDQITAQDVVIGKYIVSVKPSAVKAFPYSFKIDYFFTAPKSMVSIANVEGGYIPHIMNIDGSIVYPSEVSTKDPHPELWKPVLVKDIITPVPTKTYSFFPDYYFNSIDDPTHNRLYFSVIDVNTHTNIILYAFNTISQTTERVKVFSNDNVPQSITRSDDERYIAFKILSCFACEPSPKSTILFDTLTGVTKEIPYVSSFRWLTNGGYEYTEYILDETTCEDAPRYACDTIDPKKLPL